MNLNEIANKAGVQGLTNITIDLICIMIAWFIVQQLRLEKMTKRPNTVQARMLQVVLAIIIGHLLASFIIDYWQWSLLLRGLVE